MDMFIQSSMPTVVGTWLREETRGVGGKNVCFFRFVGFFGIIAQDIDWTH